MHRRHFITNSAALSLFPIIGWADVGKPQFLSAANRQVNGQIESHLLGIASDAEIVFAHKLPARGHSIAAHPQQALATIIARRPGRFAYVFDCAKGDVKFTLNSPKNRHFYGHATYSADGQYLYTTENDYANKRGVIGVWSTSQYKRIGEFPSGGMGPHDIIRLKDNEFAVANGGIMTHPDFARSKLNLPDMQPSLSYINDNGKILENVLSEENLKHNSIRHIARDDNNVIHIALQWQGKPGANIPLYAQHRRGEPLRFFSHPDTNRLKHYAGSIAVNNKIDEVLLTGPKGNSVLIFNRKGKALTAQTHSTASGAAALANHFIVSGGHKLITTSANSDAFHSLSIHKDWTFDNHLQII